MSLELPVYGLIWGPWCHTLAWLLWTLQLILSTSWVSAASGRSRINQYHGVERRLFAQLFDNYNSLSRPVRNASSTVSVDFGLSLNQILDLDEKNQVLTTAVWIYEEWIDENLKWEPEVYQGLNMIVVPSELLWVPDIFIFNTASENNAGYVNVTGSKIMIKPSGRVRWMVPLMIKSSCSVDVTYFPYDSQQCTVRFGSWVYDGEQLNLFNEPSKPDLSKYVENSEFVLLNVSLSRVAADSDCCPGDGWHPMIHFTIEIDRKSLYYDYIVIAPTLMLCVMTLASFLLPCHCGEKIAIGLTVFLTLYVLELLVAENTPDSNATPILGVFLILVMTLNCVSLIMATVVMNIRKHADEKLCPKVPPCLLWMCKKCLSKFTITRLRDWQHPIVSCEEMRGSRMLATSLSDLLEMSEANTTDFPTCKELTKNTQDGESQQSHTICCHPSNYRSSYDTDSVTNMGIVSLTRRKYEWYFCAEVVDKFSFFIYGVIMGVTILTSLVIVPYTQSRSYKG
ncbi:neuronal acetylcholine receptor subunit alpha-10-like isoform X1 [Octopus sinensis]|uniref:Neuronal acetylcholine receptor subunit alpha-10-like isoform X1 n=1 Tax=Octopus sinensis TaxID=2607531 RepID=A0A6P7SZK7_9MOLL|nr:neuronal acetylcholine receptor subunit alpha-10-like isoform X1 [Octopus sinensis]